MKIAAGIAGAALLAAGLALAATGCARAPDAQPAAPVASAAAPGTVTPATPAPATAPASDEPLAWMAGQWCGKDEEQVLEETWLSPRKNEMLGLGRTLAGGRMISFEYMRIMEIEGVVTFIGQPGGDAPTSFKRSDGGDGWIRFENKQHDYPQRIEYRRDGEGLKAEIAGPGEPGKEAVIAFSYQRCGK